MSQPPGAETASRGRLSTALGIASVAGYPALVWFGLRYLDPRWVGGLLAVGAIALTWGRRRMGLGLSAVGLTVAGLLALTAAVDDPRGIYWVPAVWNGGFALVFGGSLLSGPPTIERFARLIDPDLQPEEQAWCRRWTQVWTAWFLLNIGVVSALALVADRSLWAAWCGGVVYLGMALLFSLEYVLRKARFGRFRDHFADRALERALSSLRVRSP